ncbi:spore maturation protein CgeB [Knoellia remsis]|uniref:Spore maturation protein CgeB n=1 Tax=Knoellia remsis TaxID=407159 RepID=A0A2T0UZD0_9MICO|nr:glycosyltransferase [Knoellia remsis]PRY63217.1 spore maturation protein CgeB [Knoellia remsis]
MTARSLLLVTPRFHGYWNSIADAAERRGYAVRTHLYDDHPTVTDKVRVKAAEALGRMPGPTPLALGPDLTGRAVDALREGDPDVVLVVKGDDLGAAFWETLSAMPARRVMWLYDELRRTDFVDGSLESMDAVASYSPLDVATFIGMGLRAVHVPLAHDQRVRFVPRPSDEVTFVGARYPRREELLTALAELDVPVRAHGRDWSTHPVDRLRTWRLTAPAVESGRDLDRTDAYGVMAGSVATLNVHGDQDGFTMRTFEASGIGALQLVDREDVADLYEPGTEVLTFDGADEAAEHVQRARRDPAWAAGIREAAQKRTLAEHTFDHRVAALEELWG